MNRLQTPSTTPSFSTSPSAFASSSARGFTIIDLLATAAVLILLCSLVVPVLGRVKGESGTAVSMDVLFKLGVAHKIYAADHDGRQLTAVVDEFSTYGNTGSACVIGYASANGQAHPPVILGYGP